jgi:hypothetical protein
VRARCGLKWLRTTGGYRNLKVTKMV